MEKNKEEIKPYQRIVYAVILFIAIIWCAGILIAPFWGGEQGFKKDTSEFLYTFYSTSCHQDDARTLHIAGYELGVCSRCTAIYFSFLLASVLYPFIRKLNNLMLPPLWILLAGAGLVALDAGLDIFGIVENTFISREITGAIIGFILPFYIIPGSIMLVNEFFTPSKIIPQKEKDAKAG
jgi:uncharacterized membrane protein